MEETTLSIKFENKKPVELNQFTLSLNALSLEYETFLKKEYPSDYSKKERKLYIVSVDRGSIIIELAGMILPLIQDANTIIEFFNYVKDSFEFFLGRCEKKHEYSKNSLAQLSTFLNSITNDSGAKIQFCTKSGDIINNNYYISSIEANASQNDIRRRLDMMRSDNKIAHLNKVYMRWANTSFEKNRKNYADRVIIDQIDPNPKKVVFSNENDKAIATSYNSNFPETNWQSLVYVVDVEIYYLENALKAYTVTKLYSEDTFDPFERE